MKRITLDELRHLPKGAIVMRDNNGNAEGNLHVWHNCYVDHGEEAWPGKPLLYFGYAVCLDEDANHFLINIPSRFYYRADFEDATGEEAYWLLEKAELNGLAALALAAVAVEGQTQEPWDN